MRNAALIGSITLVVGLAACDSSSPIAPAADASREDGGALDSGPRRDAGPPVEACAGGCLVGGTCFPDGVINPSNPCEICAAALAPTAFSANDGGVCDDGMFCTTGDRCSAGACSGSPQACDDGIACTGVATCDEAADACTSGTSTCAGGEICDALGGTCVLECSGCLIDGTCYGDGQVSASNPCEVCAVTSSRTAWTSNDGASCDDGLYCTSGDACAASTCTGGAARVCDDGIACNGAEACDETASACAPGAITCGTDQICDVSTDACITACTGCVIGGVCYGAGQRNPADQCQVCAVATSRTAWSSREGASCDDGAFCTDGDVCGAGVCAGTARVCSDGISCNGAETCDETANACTAGTSTCAATELCNMVSDSCVTACSGCVIGGVCFANDTRNPMNECEVCETASSSTAWTVDAGSACDDGLYCTTGETCSATAVCGGGAARACADAVACNGTETCNESTDRCDVGTPTCTGGEICDTTTDTCALSCVGGTTLCGGSCTNTSFDPNNCGGCGTVCPGSEACVSGTCRALACPVFVGTTTWSQNGVVQSDAQQDALMGTACEAAFPGSRPATVTEIVTSCVIGMPPTNTTGQWLVPACPECAGAPQPDCVDGHARNCVDPGAAYPTSLPWTLEDYCYSSTRSTMCVR